MQSRKWSDPEWKGFDNKKWGTACVLYLNLLLCVWLHISGGLNCCQEFRRRVIGVRIEQVKDIKDIIDINL